MAIALRKIGSSAGIGLLDIVAEEVDLHEGYTKPFQNITDWGRVAYTVGGYTANHMGYNEEVTEAIVLSGLPLIEKSIWKAVKRYSRIGRKGRMGLKLKNPGKNTPPARTRIMYV